MARLISVMLVSMCQIGLSMQACAECTCCKGSHTCDSNKNCVDGCIDGYYGSKCTEECQENCEACVTGNVCIECKPGYYTVTCSILCGKGCVNNVCSISSGECLCKSTDFIEGKCDNCTGNKYGDKCNKTCPSNCSTCISDTECTLCLISMFYGSRCQYSCSIGCKVGMCDKDDGHCINGCKSGFSGDKCDTCLPGLYGKDCKLNCGKGCVNNTCLISSGDCPCKSSNFITRKCDACSDDKYGDECNKTCPSNCGHCISDTECSWCKNTLFYGSYCQFRCSGGCSRGSCNKSTGHCSDGCKPNFSGYKCDTCSPGLYGSYCDLKCPENCLTCLSTTNCSNCKSGFYGEACTKTCPIGCDGNCSLIDGRCFECKLGFNGEYCNFTCKNEKYGVNCSQLCRYVVKHCYACISNESGIYGGCTCDRGYYPVSAFGYNQSICTNCPNNCKGNICDTTGLCNIGCIQGFKGPTCVEAIQPAQEGHTTGTLIGSILGSFVAGCIIVGVAALIVFIVWRRRHGYNKQACSHGYENTPRHGDYGPSDNALDNDSPVTYEDLKSRDERLYSQITTSQQISPPATDYVNYN